MITTARQSLADAIEAAGLGRPPIVEDGTLRRFRAPGDHSENSWYVAHGDGAPAGAFGCWKRGIAQRWSDGGAFTKIDRERIAEENSKRARIDAAVKAEAARRAYEIWQDAEPVESHPYLIKKGVEAHGARVTKDGALVVPARDSDGAIHTVEFIYPDGSKLFLKGGAKRGNFYAIGEVKDRVYVAEGFATGATVHEATGTTVAVAFDAGNLLPVARAIRTKYPEVKIVFAADDDDAGRTKAEAAAREVDGAVVIPKFAGAREGLTDFNDLAVAEGPDVVRAQLTATDFTSRKGFQLTPLGALLAEKTEATEYVVDGLLPTAGFSLITAPPKVGKTVFARNLALAVARGEPFLGRVTKQGPVLYLALEEKRAEVKRHFAEMGATGDEPIYVHCAIAPQDAVAELQKIVAEHKPILVIGDTILKLVRVRDANDYALMSNALEPILHIARTTGAHVAGTHHSKKGDATDGDSILGSQAIFGAVDTAVLLRRCEHFRTVYTLQRYGDDMPETILDFDPATRIVTLGELKELGESHRMQSAMLDFVGAAKGKTTQKEIEDALEGRTAVKRRALRELYADGRIQREGTGRRGDPFVYRVDFGATPEQGNKKPNQTPETTSDYLFVVPAHLRVHGNKKPNGDLITCSRKTYSCSRDSGTRKLHGTRNEETTEVEV